MINFLNAIPSKISDKIKLTRQFGKAENNLT